MVLVRLKPGFRHIAKGGYVYTGGQEFRVTEEALKSFGDKFEVLPEPEEEEVSGVTEVTPETPDPEPKRKYKRK